MITVAPADAVVPSLSELLEAWQSWLTSLALEGLLAEAAAEASGFAELPAGWSALFEGLAAGDSGSLPGVELGEEEDLDAPLAVFQPASGVIVINPSWFATAEQADIFIVFNAQLALYLLELEAAAEAPLDFPKHFAVRLSELSWNHDYSFYRGGDEFVYTTQLQPSAGLGILEFNLAGSEPSLILDASQAGGAFLSGRLRFLSGDDSFSEVELAYRSLLDPEQELTLEGSRYFEGVIFGTLLDGSVTMTTPITPYVQAGEYELYRVSLYSAGDALFIDSETDPQAWEAFLQASGFGEGSRSFSIANTAPADSTPPQITGFSLTGLTSIQLGRPSGEFLSGSLSFTDQGSGYRGARFTFVPEGSTGSNPPEITLYFFGDAIRGTVLAGADHAGYRFDQYIEFPPGRWQLASVAITDLAGNEFHKANDDADWEAFLAASNIDTTGFELKAPESGVWVTPDSAAPTLRGLRLDQRSLNLNQPGGAYLSAQLDFADQQSGYYTARVFYRSPSGKQEIALGFGSNASGTGLLGTAYTGKQLIQGYENGTWTLQGIELTDNNWTRAIKYKGQQGWDQLLSAAGLKEADLSFTITNSAAADTKPPEIKALQIVSDELDLADVADKLYLGAELSFTDQLAGMQGASFRYQHVGQPFSSSQLSLGFSIPDSDYGLTAFAGSHLDGTLVTGQSLNTDDLPGIYRLASASIDDKVGNSSYWPTFSYGYSDPDVAWDSLFSADAPIFIRLKGPDSPAVEVVHGVLIDRVTEAGTRNLLYGFRRFGDVSEPLEVGFAVAGTASHGSDYILSGAESFNAVSRQGKLRFASGESTAKLTIDPTTDSLAEADETVQISLLAGPAYAAASTLAVTGTINASSAAVTLPFVALDLDPTEVLENGGGKLLYRVSRYGSTSAALSVAFAISGNAAPASDYTVSGATTFAAGTGTLTIPANAAAATLTITPKPDTTPERDESVVVQLQSNSALYQLSSGGAVTGRILNDDLPAISLQLAPTPPAPTPTVAENGTAGLAYIFSRTEPSDESLSVSYLVSGTASLGSDYSGIAAEGDTKSVVFEAGATTATVIVTPVDDQEVEAPESVILRVVGAGSTYTASTAAVTGTITSDDLASVSLELLGDRVNEDSGTPLRWVFRRNGPTTAALPVRYALSSNGTITGSGSDFSVSPAGSGATRTLTFAAESAAITLSVTPTRDTECEADETVSIALLPSTSPTPSYAIATGTAVIGTIVNDDLPAIRLTLPAPTEVRENSGTALQYQFSRTGPTGSELTVNYLVSGSATPGSDYTGIDAGVITKSVKFAVGATTATVVVTPVDDSEAELKETVVLRLAADPTYAAQTSAVTGTLVSDDLPSVSVSLSSAAVAEDGTSNLLYVFSRDGDAAAPLTVNLGFGGVAGLASDYTQIGAKITPSASMITFAAKKTSITLTIDPKPDSDQEPDESVIVSLSAGSGYRIGSSAVATGTISNDDHIGDAGANTLSGTEFADLLDGLAGSDSLTGKGGPDIFRFGFGQSSLTAPDSITDFAFGSDKIRLRSGTTAFTVTAFRRAADNSTAATLAALGDAVFRDFNHALPGDQTLPVKAAALVVANHPAIAGTYLFINNNNAPLDSTDLLINLTGHSGTLPAIGVISPITSLLV